MSTQRPLKNLHVKKIAILNLRQEYTLSGQSNSHRFLKNLLKDTDIELNNDFTRKTEKRAQGIPLLNLANIKKWQNSFHEVEILILKIPTPAQVFFASQFFGTFPGRLVYWIDSQNWQSLPIKPPLQLLRNEPILTAMRLISNRNFWFRFSQKKSTLLVVSSKTQKKQLLSIAHPQSSIHVIPNGTLLEENITQYKGKKFDKDKFVLGYIGHARMVKGLPDLLWVLNKLKKTGYSFETRLAFSGIGKKKLVNSFRNANFSTEGLVNKAEFYNSLDLLILPYWTDSATVVFPNVLLESLYFGVPVVTTKLNITLELFDQGNLAHFFNPRDRTALYRKVADILDGTTRLPSSTSLQQYFKNHFSKSIITKKWLELLLSS